MTAPLPRSYWCVEHSWRVRPVASWCSQCMARTPPPRHRHAECRSRAQERRTNTGAKGSRPRPGAQAQQVRALRCEEASRRPSTPPPALRRTFRPGPVGERGQSAQAYLGRGVPTVVSSAPRRRLGLPVGGRHLQRASRRASGCARWCRRSLTDALNRCCPTRPPSPNRSRQLLIQRVEFGTAWA